MLYPHLMQMIHSQTLRAFCSASWFAFRFEFVHWFLRVYSFALARLSLSGCYIRPQYVGGFVRRSLGSWWHQPTFSVLTTNHSGDCLCGWPSDTTYTNYWARWDFSITCTSKFTSNYPQYKRLLSDLNVLIYQNYTINILNLLYP